MEANSSLLFGISFQQRHTSAQEQFQAALSLYLPECSSHMSAILRDLRYVTLAAYLLIATYVLNIGRFVALLIFLK